MCFLGKEFVETAASSTVLLRCMLECWRWCSSFHARVSSLLQELASASWLLRAHAPRGWSQLLVKQRRKASVRRISRAWTPAELFVFVCVLRRLFRRMKWASIQVAVCRIDAAEFRKAAIAWPRKVLSPVDAGFLPRGWITCKPSRRFVRCLGQQGRPACKSSIVWDLPHCLNYQCFVRNWMNKSALFYDVRCRFSVVYARSLLRFWEFSMLQKCPGLVFESSLEVRRSWCWLCCKV